MSDTILKDQHDAADDFANDTLTELFLGFTRYPAEIKSRLFSLEDKLNHDLLTQEEFQDTVKSIAITLHCMEEDPDEAKEDGALEGIDTVEFKEYGETEYDFCADELNLGPYVTKLSSDQAENGLISCDFEQVKQNIIDLTTTSKEDHVAVWVTPYLEEARVIVERVKQEKGFTLDPSQWHFINRPEYFG